VICGGWPCQDLSVAGRRAGLIEGKRSSLFFEAMRIIKELQDAGVGPTFALFENVPGLLSSNGGNDFAVVLAELANVGALDIAWRVLDSQFFGVAQRRRRVFIVADFRGERAAEILALSEGLYGHPAPSREAEEGTAGGAGVGAQATGDGFYREGLGPLAVSDDNGTNQLVAQSLAIRGRDGTPQAELGTDGLANAILTPSGGRAGMGCGAVLAHTLRAEGFDASEDGTGRGTPIVVTQDSSPLVMDDLSPTLKLGTGFEMGQPPCVVAFQGGAQQDQIVPPGAAVPTLAHSSNTHGGHHQPKVMEGAIPRRLTPGECEALQSFPPGWTAYGTREDGTRCDMADGPRYRFCGNAVTVSVVNWIAYRIMVAEAELSDMTLTPAAQTG